MNLALSLQYAAERFPERAALLDGEIRLTYDELRDRVARAAHAHEQLGLGRGGRLAAVLRNRHETVELYWAAQWLGASFVPLSWRASQSDIDYCIDDCGASLVAVENGESVEIGQRTFEELLGADLHPGAFDVDERAESLMLYTS